ncbi:hypothetical protein KIN20_037134 [Parelaphostrongylus tenuis]|uniref:Uncharacterized protein n=1 Tax=Parelaphostrongylus tenuis TaxID=148309 RepID=A0AAD5RE51_PARTN|nr:hypothetical protein KIN20_037134 [Parelaphostrongylus tenuis]
MCLPNMTCAQVVTALDLEIIRAPRDYLLRIYIVLMRKWTTYTMRLRSITLAQVVTALDPKIVRTPQDYQLQTHIVLMQNWTACTKTSSRRNTSLSAYGAEDEARSYPSRLSTASLHASDAELNHPPHMSSRHSSYSSVHSIPCKDARDSEKLSAANSSCGALDCLHTASSQHNTCSSVYGGEEEVPPNSSRLSAASLHASDAEVNHPPHMSSRHSSYSSVHSIPCKDTRDSEKSSAANIHSSCGAVDRLHTASSQHSTCSSVYGGAEKVPPNSSSTQVFTASHVKMLATLKSRQLQTYTAPLEQWTVYILHLHNIALARVFMAVKRKFLQIPPSYRQRVCIPAFRSAPMSRTLKKKAPPNLSKLSGVSLLTTGTEVDRSLQASRQHSTYSSAQNIPSNEVMDSASLSTTDFHSSDTQTASARSIASSKHANPSMRSRTNSYSTGVEHNRQRDASSQHNICSSVHNNTSKNPPIYSSLNICGSASEPDRLNNCLSVYGVEERAPAYSSKLSTTSLRVSDVEVNHPVHTNSRHSSSANVHSVTVEARPDSSRLSTAVLHSSDAKGDYQLHSQNNNCPSVLDIEVKAASCSSKLSTASLCPSDRNVHHSSHISSVHDCSSVHSTVSKERSNSSNLSIEKSHSHGAELDHLHNRSSSHSIASKDLPNDSRLSTASLYGSGAELDHQRNVSSQQNICSSVYGADQEAPAYSSRLSTASMPISDAKMKQPLLTSAST